MTHGDFMHRPSLALPAAMHHSRCALAALALAGSTGAAFAHSSVTLFGGLDAGMRHVSNAAGSKTAMQSGNNYTSRWGIRGEEDLGGGLKASFWLETALNVANGNAGSTNQFWDRRSTVSLSGSYGELRLGRDYTPIFRGFSPTDIFGYAGAASMVSLYSASASNVVSRAFGTKTSSIARTNGAVQYFTPATLGGFYLNAMYANTGGGAASGDYDYKGLRVGYNAGPLDLAVSGGRTRIDHNGQNQNFAIHSVSAIYRLPNRAKLTAGVVQMKYMDAKQANYSVGVDYPIGVGQVRATFHHIDQSGRAANGTHVGGQDANMLALGYVHNLSKRTAVYGTAAFFRNQGSARFTVPGGPSGSAAGTNSRGFDVGLRHIF
jgi:predicted porin